MTPRLPGSSRTDTLLPSPTPFRSVQVEAVGVLHQKLAPAHHAEAGTYLVAELPLDVVERARQVAIASGGIAEDRGDHFLCRRAVQHLPLVAVLEAEHFRAIGVIAPAFAPAKIGSAHV